MNNRAFVEAFSKQSGYNLEESKKISKLCDKFFIVGKNNKEKLIQELINEMQLTEEEANRIYEIRSSIISQGIKDKIRHPFHGQE